MTSLSGKEKKILQELEKAFLGYTQRELKEATQLSRPSIKKYCRSLAERDLVAVVEKGAAKIYYATENLPENYEEELSS
jgi:DNA-binding Lrp family transcriptional regulator